MKCGLINMERDKFAVFLGLVGRAVGIIYFFHLFLELKYGTPQDKHSGHFYFDIFPAISNCIPIYYPWRAATGSDDSKQSQFSVEEESGDVTWRDTTAVAATPLITQH